MVDLHSVAETQERARKHIKIADRMLTQTYPIVQDPKLLLAILESIYAGMRESVMALLFFERYHRRISTIAQDFDIQFNTLKLEIAGRYDIPHDVIKFIQDIKLRVAFHKDSPVEFSRKDSFIMCSPKYETKVLTTESIKDALKKAKQFIGIVDTIISKKEERAMRI